MAYNKTMTLEQAIIKYAPDSKIARSDIAKIYRCSEGKVRNYEKKLGVKWHVKTRKGVNNPMYGKKRPDFRLNHWTKTKPEMQTGKNNHQWKGGSFIKNGYRYILVAKNKYKPEHVLVIEKHIGRSLKSSEVVHHKDRNRSNNSLDNLLLLPSQSEHIKLHHKQGDLHAKI